MLTEQAKALGIHPSQQKKGKKDAKTEENQKTGKAEEEANGKAAE